MTLLWGAILAAGVLLTVSPWLWPHDPNRRKESDPRPSRAIDLLAAAGFAHRSPALLVIACLGLAVVIAAAVWLATGVPVLVLVGALATAALPVMWLRGRSRSLRRARRMLWPDICDLLIAAVRSGLSLPDAVATLATSAPGPVRPVFAAYASDLAASGHFDTSILRVKAALADPVADRIVETLRMAREVGGTELVPVLRSLSSGVRADATVRSEAEARQSWVRGAAVLGVVAPWVVMILLAIRPEGARAYSSPEGVVLIVVSAVVSVVAFRLMLRLGRLPEPRRWFG
ncbi:MAG: type II secretion system F family protein [Microbacterium sp.]|uniref:type II secretion system F family protein n=1 Tax=Microbacterium sp. TaxID=51671 RepID=UPI0026316517|nr:type II secretion system F family protein [Microbacterium sp.]MCX6502460.1 type II secretion system F family protein [Microbacterium sp.]